MCVLAAVAFAALHEGPGARSPWTHMGFLGLCFAALAGALVAAFPLPAPVDTRPSSDATTREILSGLLFAAAVLTFALIWSDFPTLHGVVYPSMFLLALLGPLILQSRLSACLPWRWTTPLPYVLAASLFTVGAFQFAVGNFSGIESPRDLHWSDLATWSAFKLVFLAPIAEEALFRGALWHALERFAKPLVTLVITAVLFTLAHRWAFELVRLESGHWVGIAVGGLCCGALRMRTGSLWPGMLAHALANLLIQPDPL